jgi:virginiamycin A acetyltransferase
MFIVKKIKRKLSDLIIKKIESFNRIDESAVIHPTAFIKGSKIYGNVKIEEKVKIYKSEISGDIHIGRYSSLWGPGIYLQSELNPIIIGNFCSIARNLTIQEFYHDYNKLTTFYIGRNVFGEDIRNEIRSKGSVQIGHDVWIGVNVTILSGVKIGNGVVIGANSIVTKDIPAYSIVGGNPAKIIKYRFSEERIQEFEQLEWWNWNIQKIKENKLLFKKEYSNEN